MMKYLTRLLFVIALLTACGAPSSAPVNPVTPTRAPLIAPTSAPNQPAPTIVAPTTAPTSPPRPTPTPPTAALSPDQVVQLTVELSKTVAAALPPPPTPDSSGNIGPAIEGVNALPLKVPPGSPPLWAVFTYGMRDFFTNQSHFIATYTYTNRRWQRLNVFDLQNPDYIDPSGVRQVQLEPTHIWLEVQSGVGAHGGCYDLYALDPSGRALDDAASNCGDSPGAGSVSDVNGDGQLDVVLNHTDSYVFCYACGERYPQFTVMRWDGTKLSEIDLTPLPDSTPNDLRQLNNRAVDLAKAGLWKDAQATIDQAVALNAHDATVAWNAGLIQLHSSAFLEQVNAKVYPVLDNVFYGDYAAALDVLRPYQPAELFTKDSPLIKGTPAENFEDALSSWITSTTTAAIQLQPDLAAAYFLRGWAEYLANPTNPAALSDIDRAAQLDPTEALFSQSVVYLKK
jgi:hypothetical protein